MTITITLSWFHRKIGPTIYYEYPEGNLSSDDLTKIPDLMDTKFEEGFFSHSFETLYLFNYFFEIGSKWARGQKEILLMSVCFTNPISTQIQHEILVHCIDFANNLKTTHNMFKAFYLDSSPSGEFPTTENDEKEIKDNDRQLKLSLQDLYWRIVSFSRAKFEEEITAELLSKPSVHEVIKFLSSGPISKEVLERWYHERFPELNLEDVLTQLESQKFIVQNEIEHVQYVLLVKVVKVQRIPPECIITLIQEKPKMMELMDEFTDRVGAFFVNYKETLEDSKDLIRLVANHDIYNVLMQLRAGPIPKNRILTAKESEPIKNLIGILNLLKEKKIIDEFKYQGETQVLLIDDIQFSTSFPEYLMEFAFKQPIIPPSTSELGEKSIQSPLTGTTINTKAIPPSKGSGLENLEEEVFTKLKNLSKKKTNPKKDGQDEG